MSHLLCFGLGFSAMVFAARLAAKGFRVTATSRSPEGAARIAGLGYRGLIFGGTAPLPRDAFDGVSHLLISAPPDAAGDPVLRQQTEDIAAKARQFTWAGYLSTTGVYGDHGGAWVGEETPLTPNTERGERRLAAEQAWSTLYRDHGLPIHIFRLAGIYGPGRNAIRSLRQGTTKRVVKQGQVFSRIHVEDIATVLEASMARPNPGAAYNVCDDEPCPPQEVIVHAARLLGIDPPPEIAFDGAQLSAMAKSFYADSKRVSNARIKRELGVRLAFPTYREGLASLLKE
ncbi:MAG: SDR family oxidoreductase [Rhizobiales bacterium]|nr:SDR family oxidoreductase [Hyphomicrobiales bacterium]MBI3672999.1 SDR family oxidoreductase [Hyphomicrobiales bacterium]